MLGALLTLNEYPYPKIRAASSDNPAPMLPNKSPSTRRAVGTISAILLRNRLTPLEPPVKKTVSTSLAFTPASASIAASVSLISVTRWLMDRSNWLRLTESSSSAEMRSSVSVTELVSDSAIFVSSTFNASQWPSLCSTRFSRRRSFSGSLAS